MARAFAGKHYAVLGLARSGLATVDALLASGAKVTAWDDCEEARAKAPAGVTLEDLIGSDLSRFNSIVATPGLPLNRHPIAAEAKAAGIEIIGDIELFARARPELPPHKVVGITGTNGKSTTTALIHHILQTAGVPSLMGGNIGLPILAQDPLPNGGVYVLELSSYQIDLTHSLDCDVAVLLNIAPDHLDRYESVEAYRDSKLRLFEMQTPYEHLALVMTDSATTCDLVSKLRPYTVVKLNTPKRFSKQYKWPSLQGSHNRQNAKAAIEATMALGTEGPFIEVALQSYAGLPHRMERVREKNGVLFVNDSKATNPTATAPALAAFSALRWILGGQAKSDDLDECAPAFDHVRKAYAIGEAAPMFTALLREADVDVAECGTLERAVHAAAAEAEPGDTVLLSPACASFDQFRDFEARGDAFRELVRAL